MKSVVQTIKSEIAALRRLAKSVPDDALAQASIAGQVGALRWAMGRVTPSLLACAVFMMVAGNVAFAQTPLAPATQRPTSLAIDSGTKTATATAGAATLNKSAGVITSEALTTAAGAVYTLTLTNSAIAAADQVYVEVGSGTNTTVGPSKAGVKVNAGSVVVDIRNTHASAALTGTLKVSFLVIKN